MSLIEAQMNAIALASDWDDVVDALSYRWACPRCLMRSQAPCRQTPRREVAPSSQWIPGWERRGRLQPWWRKAGIKGRQDNRELDVWVVGMEL